MSLLLLLKILTIRYIHQNTREVDVGNGNDARELCISTNIYEMPKVLQKNYSKVLDN